MNETPDARDLDVEPPATVEPPAVAAERCSLVTRREFVRGLGATFAVTTAAGYGISIWGRNPAYAAAAPPAGSFDYKPGRVLVVVEMGGGNDSLNMIVPHSNPAYHDARQGLATRTVHELDAEFGLHPGLGPVADRYAQGKVAIVHGLGYPDAELSHFAAQADWWSADPGVARSTGWLGRWLDGTTGGGDPLAAVTIGPGPAPALLGDSSFVVAIQDTSGLAPAMPPWIDRREELLDAWAGFAASPVDSPEMFARVQRAIDATDAARRRLASALGGAAPSQALPSARGIGTSGMETEMGPAPTDGSLEASLDIAATLILSTHVSPSIIYVHGFGDFDTHTSEKGRHRLLMEDFGRAIDRFFTRIDGARLSDRVLLVTTSEFGRRVEFNGSGTDHGSAGDHFVIGSAVAGGRYGEAPSLTDLDDRENMKHTMDFRSLFASVLDSWLGTPHQDILGGTYETLPLLGPPAGTNRRKAPRLGRPQG